MRHVLPLLLFRPASDDRTTLCLARRKGASPRPLSNFCLVPANNGADYVKSAPQRDKEPTRFRYPRIFGIAESRINRDREISGRLLRQLFRV